MAPASALVTSSVADGFFALAVKTARYFLKIISHFNAHISQYIAIANSY
jgi:hypothetical protein